MNRLLALSVVLSLAIISCLALLAPAQEAGEERPLTEVEQLRQEVWALKHLHLHADLLRKAGMSPEEHRPLLPVVVAPLDRETAALLELEPGRGLEVKDVKGGIPGFEKGDVILRIKNAFSGWQPATRTVLEYLFLPGDTAVFQVYRKGQRLVVKLTVGCKCGKGQACPYFSSLAGPPDPGAKRHVVQPVFPDPDRPVLSAQSFFEVFRKSIDGYYDDLFAAEGDASKVDDIQRRLNRLARELGCKDWADLCTKVAQRDPDGYKRAMENLSKYATDKAKDYVEKVQKRAREKTDDDGEDEGK